MLVMVPAVLLAQEQTQTQTKRTETTNGKDKTVTVVEESFLPDSS